MNKAWAIAAAALSLAAGGLVSPAVASAASPAPIVVDFTGDTAGVKPNGFSSAGAADVFFYDTQGANLHVLDYGAQSHGNGLAADFDDHSALEIRLSAPTNAISLAFGNDDPLTVNSSDLARLTLFRGLTQVGQVDVNVNANDVMDQTIGTSSEPLFNRATFQYVDAVGNPKNLAEIVDDITVNPLCTVAGTTGNDNLVGTDGNDVICGDAGDDTISGGAGDDVIYGGAGSDTISGGSGVDTIVGESGDDTLSGGADADQVSGGSGSDDIAGRSGPDQLTGGTGRDDIFGGKGRDQISGGTGQDELSGGSGRDELSGGPGRDQLSGGRGRDHLAGGSATDHCDGGKGHDTSTSCELHTRIP